MNAVDDPRLGSGGSELHPVSGDYGGCSLSRTRLEPSADLALPMATVGLHQGLKP